VDITEVDPSVLVEGQDESIFSQFGSKLSDRVRKASLNDLTVWVDPLDGTQVSFPNPYNHILICFLHWHYYLFLLGIY